MTASSVVRQKKCSPESIPEHGVSTSACMEISSAVEEWFCPVDLNLEKMKLMMQTHL